MGRKDRMEKKWDQFGRGGAKQKGKEGKKKMKEKKGKKEKKRKSEMRRRKGKKKKGKSSRWIWDCTARGKEPLLLWLTSFLRVVLRQDLDYTARCPQLALEV